MRHENNCRKCQTDCIEDMEKQPHEIPIGTLKKHTYMLSKSMHFKVQVYKTIHYLKCTCERVCVLHIVECHWAIKLSDRIEQ